jgi:nucleotide-binding universal stress UspA family protein
MFKHILFPTDGSELSDVALGAAVELATATGARLTALHVIDPYHVPPTDLTWVFPDAMTPEEYERVSVRLSNAILHRAKAAAEKAAVACETLSLFAKAPWGAIVKAVDEYACDVVVMASHGRRGIAGMLIGSETQKVLTHSRVPVLVYR